MSADTVSPLAYNTTFGIFNRHRFEYLKGYYFEEVKNALYYRYVKDKTANYDRISEDNSLYQRLHVHTLRGRRVFIDTEDLYPRMAKSVETATTDKIFRGCITPITRQTQLSPITIKSIEPHHPMDVYRLTDNYGKKVMVTLETQILTYNGFVKVKNLIKGNMLYNMTKYEKHIQYSYIDTIVLTKKHTKVYNVSLNEPDHHIVSNGFVLL